MRIKTTNKSNLANKVRAAKRRRAIYITSAVILIVAAIAALAYFLLHQEPDISDPSRTDVSQNSSQTPGTSAQSIDSDKGQIRIIKAVFSPEYLNGKDVLKVVAEAKGPKGSEEIQMKYEWKINSQDAGNGGDNISGFKRGDKISVKITPYIENQAGYPVTLSLQIANTTPGVFGGKELTNDGKAFTYQINAQDPDGDALSYELLSGPEGMTIDKKSGLVNWPVKENSGGEYPVKVRIIDGQGGEITYQLTATIPKQPPSTATIPRKSP
jgi:hypothetical protein